MIFVDISVWIEVLRAGESPEARHLSALLDEGAVAVYGCTPPERTER